MDDLVSGKVTDASGSNLHGMCTTCPTVEAGMSLSAFRFDGGDQQIDVMPDPAFDNITRGISAAAWVKVDMPPPAIPGCAMVKGGMWSLCITPQMNPAFGSFIASSPITAAAWHHLAITYDGKDRRIYVDGAEVGSMPGAVMADAGGLVIGAELVGLVDEAQVFSGVLTAAEITDLMTP